MIANPCINLVKVNLESKFIATSNPLRLKSYSFKPLKHLSSMKNFTLSLIALCVAVSLQAQIWEPHNADFPLPTQGWRITPANDSVAWTFGFVLDSAGDFAQRDYSYSRTTDGGNTWVTGTFAGIQTDGWLCHIFAQDENKAWLSFFDYAEGGKIFYTSDGGQNWDLTNAPVENIFIGALHFWDNDHGVIWGDPIDSLFSILTTSNGGLSWEQVSAENMPAAIDNEEYTGAGNIAVNGDNVWFDTYYNRVLYSADRGHTWTVWDNPSADHYGLDVKADEDNYLYYIHSLGSNEDGYTFELFRRHPDDSDWTNLTPADNSKYISGFSHVPGTNTLVANLINETRVSYDHGDTWTSIDIDTTFRRGYLSFVNDQTGYSCQMPEGFENPSENVYKYIGTPLSGLLDPKPIDITLSVSPNPAIENIQVSLGGKHAEDYWILINDLSGKLIYKAEITNENSFSRSIDVSSYLNGMYTLTVSNQHGMRTETFVKM